jgi:RHS repeat-associated protein
MGCQKLIYKPELSIYSSKPLMEKRNIYIGVYRFGFNGMEMDADIKGAGNSYTTLHRIYDPSIGRWLSVDPEFDEYPDESPFVSMENNPISETDPDGDCPWCVAFLKGAAQEYGTQVIMNIAKGKSLGDALTDVDGGEILKSAVVDGLTLGIGSIVSKGRTTVKIINATDKIVDAEKIAVKTNKISNNTQKFSKVEKNLVKAEKKLPPSCFVKGTLILTNNGLKPIEQIAKGDTVWAYNVYNTVIRQTKQLITFKIGKSIIATTPDHPFYIRNKWIDAKDVFEGDSVLLFNKTKLAITYKNVKDTECFVYNFAVENFHTYFVSDLNVLVHNSNPCAAELPSKRAQMRQAKRDAGIPTSQTHNTHKTVDAAKSGNSGVKGTEYSYNSTGSYGKKEIKTIQDHKNGHVYKDGTVDKTPHFNNHQPPGQSGGTNKHYPYKTK